MARSAWRICGAVEVRGGKCGCAPRPLEREHAAVECARFVAQLAEVEEAAADAEVGGVVAHRLDAQRPAFFEVLLDPARAIEDRDARVHALDRDVGLEDAGGGVLAAADDPPAEEEADRGLTAQTQALARHL